jgi:hypothetical protein
VAEGKAMTEAEAKTKWCPFSRVAAGVLSRDGRTVAIESGQSVHNRIDVSPGTPTLPDGATCVASTCMAWRWDVEKCLKGPGVDHGYCGLAQR